MEHYQIIFRNIIETIEKDIKECDHQNTWLQKYIFYQILKRTFKNNITIKKEQKKM